MGSQVSHCHYAAQLKILRTITNVLLLCIRTYLDVPYVENIIKDIIWIQYMKLETHPNALLEELPRLKNNWRDAGR